MASTYAPNGQFTVSEKVELLVNILASLVPDLPAYLLHLIIVDLQRQPQWMDIALPRGRTLHACQVAFEEIRRSMGQQHRLAPLNPSSTPYVNIAPAIATGRSISESDPLLDSRRPIQPRPSMRMTESPDPPARDQNSSVYSGSTSVHPMSDSKKRSRPTKAEVEERQEAYKARGQVYQPKQRSTKRIRPSARLATPPLVPADPSEVGTREIMLDKSPTAAIKDEIDLPKMQRAFLHEHSRESESSEDTNNEDEPATQIDEINLYLKPVSTSRSPQAVNPLPDETTPVLGFEQSLHEWDTRAADSDKAIYWNSGRDDFIQQFAETLRKDADTSHWDVRLTSNVCDEFDHLLTDFATRLGHESTSSELRQVVAFILKYQSPISTAFEEAISATSKKGLESCSSNEGISREDSMQLGEIQVKSAVIAEDIQESTSQSANSSFEASLDSQGFSKFKHLISETSSYKWLISALRNKSSLESTSDDIRRAIREKVLGAISRPTAVRYDTPSPLASATFAIYLRLEQDIGELVLHQIKRRVTVTGSEDEAQAMTCEDYSHQTWPITGQSVMQVFQDALIHGSSQISVAGCPDGTLVKASYSDSKMQVHVSGTRETIVEFAEQLCWMTAALSLGPRKEKAMYCLPSLQHVKESGAPEQSTTVHFKVTIEYDKVQRTSDSGVCWRYLFQHCILVKGYPIRRRPKASLGLELPLNLLARLVGTSYLHEFAGFTFLKSFSICLAISERIDEVVVWHTQRDNAGQHISYLANDLSNLPRKDMEDLADLRHIVGWCSNVKNYCGTAEGKYDVQSSILPMVGPYGALYDCSLSFGRPITGDAEFIFTANHQPLASSGKGYLDMFKFLERRFVLLWDVRSHRGWLVNGLRALLHLLRQSLKIDKEKDGGELFVLRAEDLDEPLNPYQNNAAWRFLSNQKNLSIRIALSKINRHGQEYELLGDRVQQFYDVIEKCIDYQRKPLSYWNEIPRSQLEGWDFLSLARKDNPIEPSVLALPSVGRNWVDFVRATNTVTFFGHGFGEILQSGLETCVTVPCGKFYVAVTVSDIRELMTMNRCDHWKVPRSICKTPPILWHSPTGSLVPRGCIVDPHPEPNKFDVQVMWPAGFLHLLPPSKYCLDIEKHIDGAVIFGHSDTLQHFVSDFGPPIQGIPPHPLQELELLEDSALGSSPDTNREGRTKSLTNQSSHDSTNTVSSNSENRNHAYGNNDISGSAVLGTIAGNFIVNQYYAYSANQTIGEGFLRPLTQPSSVRESSVPFKSTPRCDETTYVVDTAQRSQHAAHVYTAVSDDEVMNEMQQGEDEIREMELEGYCQVFRF